MVVGTLRIELSLPGNGSLKGKRRVLRSLIDRIRARFNVAVAEVDHLEAWQRASLGVACVSGDPVIANEVLRRVLRWVEDNHDGGLEDYRIRIEEGRED
ncbi:MAG: DUF503 domain-containing protein [Firmicutes bacterium]|nr:DUF503 domain-containing protein [Bacillota bacterium]